MFIIRRVAQFRTGEMADSVRIPGFFRLANCLNSPSASHVAYQLFSSAMIVRIRSAISDFSDAMSCCSPMSLRKS